MGFRIFQVTYRCISSRNIPERKGKCAGLSDSLTWVTSRDNQTAARQWHRFQRKTIRLHCTVRGLKTVGLVDPTLTLFSTHALPLEKIFDSTQVIDTQSLCFNLRFRLEMSVLLISVHGHLHFVFLIQSTLPAPRQHACQRNLYCRCPSPKKGKTLFTWHLG